MNQLYDKGCNKFIKGEVAWKAGGDTFRAYLLDLENYTPDLANDEFLVDIPELARVAYVAVVPTDPVGRVADAPDVTFLAVSGAPCEAVAIVKWVTNANDSPLIAYLDTITGLPVTPSGGPITITWDEGTNKIFKL